MIKQLIPADGWKAVYALKDAKHGLDVTPVVAFALTLEEDEDGGQYEVIVPMVPVGDEIDTAYPCDNFLGLVGPGGDARELFEEAAQEWLNNNKE